MQRKPSASTARWPSLALIAAGSLMIGLWLIFTNVHGPTSYNLDRPFLGRGMQFWGMLLGGPPNLLLIAALLGLAPRLTQDAPRRAYIGLGLAVFGLALAVVNALNLIGGGINELTLTPVMRRSAPTCAGQGSQPQLAACCPRRADRHRGAEADGLLHLESGAIGGT